MNMATTHSIVIADDHPVLLEGIASITQKEFPEFELIKVLNGADALQKIIEVTPTIAILDIEMPFLNGIEVLKIVKEAKLETKVIILTLHKERTFFEEVKALQVDGYVLKEFSVMEITKCIKAVLKGDTFFSDSIKKMMVTKKEDSPIFTKAENHVLKLIAKGYTSKQIADALFISVKTVDAHRYNISKKLNLKPEPNSLLKWVLTNYSEK